jgi:hypothetical protein
MDIGLGWSINRRRAEIGRVIDTLMHAHRLARIDAVDLVARRMGAGFNTVEGWISGGGSGSRSPPTWQSILLLEYELGLRPLLDLVAWGGTRERVSAKVTRIRPKAAGSG